MKALSVRQTWASMIADGSKTIETRTRFTKYRGDILIVASLKPVIPGYPVGVALCVATLVGCRTMTKVDEAAACCEIYPNAKSWLLENIRKIKPFSVKGQLGLYDVDCEDKIEYI